MLALKFIVFVLVASQGVLGRDTHRGNVRHRLTEDDYKYRHPPVPESYEAIPVAVVYDDANREDKSIKSITPANDVKEVSKDSPSPDLNVAKELRASEAAQEKPFDTKPTVAEHENIKVTTFRPQKEQQIPVAVVYDPESTYYQKPRPNRNRIINKRRKVQRPAPEQKQVDVEDGDNSNIPVNGHTGPLSQVGQEEYFNKRRKVQRPRQEEKEIDAPKTNVQPHQYTSTNPTNDETTDFNYRRNSQRPIPEGKQGTVEDNVGITMQESVTSSTLASSQQAEYFNRETLQPLEENKEIEVNTSGHENEGTPYVPTYTKADESNIRRINQRPVAEKKPTSVEDNYRFRVQDTFRVQDGENSPKYDELYNNNENTQQISRRGDAFRTRDVVPIIQSENVVFSQSGNFQYSYEAGDGTKAFETGELRTFEDESAGEAVSGGFSYKAKDGNEYSLSYTADENGYRPVGAHLPTPPPIPPAIARALAHLATKTTPEPITESIAEYDQ